MVGDKRKYNVVLITLAGSGDARATDTLGEVVNGGANTAALEVNPAVSTISGAMAEAQVKGSLWFDYLNAACPAA
eukprot:SAG11_NODE_16854_length_535_cov_0.942661_1_plen_74_part_01